MKQVQSFILSFVLLLSCLYVHVDVIAEEEQDQPTVQEETEDTTQEQSDEAQGQSAAQEQPAIDVTAPSACQCDKDNDHAADLRCAGRREHQPG